MKTNVVERIVSLAGVLDSQGKTAAPIAIAATRQTIKKTFKPEKRGGPCFFGSHELVPMPAGRRDPDTVEMFTEDGRPTEAARA